MIRWISTLMILFTNMCIYTCSIFSNHIYDACTFFKNTFWICFYVYWLQFIVLFRGYKWNLLYVIKTFLQNSVHFYAFLTLIKITQCMVYSKYGIIILSHFATIRLLHNFAYKRSVVFTRAFVDIFILFIINPITSGSNIIQGEFTCFNSKECTHARIPAVLTVYNI